MSFTLWKKVIPRGPGSVVIPQDHTQTVGAGIGVTQLQGCEGAHHYAVRRSSVSFFCGSSGPCFNLSAFSGVGEGAEFSGCSFFHSSSCLLRCWASLCLSPKVCDRMKAV